MNFRQKFTLSLLLAIVSGGVAFAQKVLMPDANLQRAVRSSLNLHSNQPITLTDLQNLELFVASKQGITDLTGLEHAVQLKRAELRGNNISDLTPLANLVTLEYLHLGENLVSDIRPLAQLTRLRVLHLTANAVVDVSPLANLTRLRKLVLHENLIVDVTPLAVLTDLESLEMQRNPATDYTVLEALDIPNFEYDQHCEVAPLLPAVQARIANRNYPSIAMPWGGGEDWQAALDRPDLTPTERIALHDIVWSGGMDPKQTPAGLKLAGDIEEELRQREEFLAINPNLVFLKSVGVRHLPLHSMPPDSPFWVRDENGDIVVRSKAGGLLDFTNPAVLTTIMEEVRAIAQCGVYDGVFFDHWNDGQTALAGWRPLEEEQRARVALMEFIRKELRPDFLVLVNGGGDLVGPLTGPLVNGSFMEGGGHGSLDQLPSIMQRIADTLSWSEATMRKPLITVLEGEANPLEPPDSPANLSRMRRFTTLSLTHSDGYAMFRIGDGSHRHLWYDFWNADLGKPVGEKEQLYQDIDGLYIREFTNGWAVYNNSGAEQTIALPELTSGVASGLEGMEHTLPDLDGEMYLKAAATDTPDVNGSDIYIAEPIDAVPGAALLLDASNNPGSIARWVNLGAAGGRLLASGRLQKVEEGEIEIPAIGFSGRRRYYTATASGQTFGGPVHLNPQLYLGDWTLEFLCKRNGNLFAEEHQFAGFQNSPTEGLQGIRLWLLNDGQELSMSIHADGFGQPERALNIFLEENLWTWVTIVSLNGESIIAYQDGVEVRRHPGVHFDASVLLNDISIGSNSYDERRRNFNGSFSIVRVYDRALSPDEVLQNIGATVNPIANPADVNGDGVVNIWDLVAVAQGLGTDNPEADVNGDGVVNVFDLVQVAGAIGAVGAAPSASSPELSKISAADVERWLALAGGLGVGDANFQRGIRFLEGLLAALTPKETTLLPNYPNPFNPETWIPYRLAQEAEVTITIYDTKGTPVRRLALGNQAAGYYAERGKAAYWDGRNEEGEAVASGIYIYQFTAGDYAASRRMVIVK